MNINFFLFLFLSIYGHCEIMKACSYKDKNNGKYKQVDWVDDKNTNRQYKPSTNLAPTDILPVLVSGAHFNNKSEKIIHPMVWGMIPPWHKVKKTIIIFFHNA